MPAMTSASDSSSPAALEEQYQKAQEHLEKLDNAEEVKARFTWCGIDFAILVTRQSHHKRLMRLDATLGHLPYSVEGAEMRQKAVAQYQSLRRSGRAGLALSLGNPGRVSVRLDTVLNADMTMEDVFYAASIVLFDMGPDLLDLSGYLK